MGARPDSLVVGNTLGVGEAGPAIALANCTRVGPAELTHTFDTLICRRSARHAGPKTRSAARERIWSGSRTLSVRGVVDPRPRLTPNPWLYRDVAGGSRVLSEFYSTCLEVGVAKKLVYQSGRPADANPVVVEQSRHQPAAVGRKN